MDLCLCGNLREDFYRTPRPTLNLNLGLGIYGRLIAFEALALKHPLQREWCFGKIR